jgi:PEP-CTERM motif
MNKYILKLGISLVTFGIASLPVQAEVVPLNGVLPGVWTGWTQFAVDDGETEPGSGGQDFDAEYFYYKKSGTTLELGLQTGFDVVDGKVTYAGADYYAGDLAISVDGSSAVYEYAVDFGLFTLDNGGHTVDADNGGGDDNSGDGIDTAGLYSVTDWNDHVIPAHISSAPFAMDAGLIVAGGLLGNSAGSGVVGGFTSYYRKVSIDLSTIGIGSTDAFDLATHWTMSCGNDEINGSVSFSSVPEPATMMMLLFGLIGIGAAGMRRRKYSIKTI